jgi:hypothetical protein
VLQAADGGQEACMEHSTAGRRLRQSWKGFTRIEQSTHHAAEALLRLSSSALISYC